MKHMQVVPPQILPLGKMNMTKNDDASDKEDWFHMSRPDKIGTCHPDLWCWTGHTRPRVQPLMAGWLATCGMTWGLASIGEKRDAQLIPTSRVMRKALVAKQREGYVDRGPPSPFWAPCGGILTVENGSWRGQDTLKIYQNISKHWLGAFALLVLFRILSCSSWFLVCFCSCYGYGFPFSPTLALCFCAHVLIGHKTVNDWCAWLCKSRKHPKLIMQQHPKTFLTFYCT